MYDSERHENPVDALKVPLSNSVPATPRDQLEKVLLERTVDAVESQPCATITLDTPVLQAVRQLANLDVTCLVVVKNQRLEGVFTKRDILDKVALQFDNVKKRPVSEVMTRKPEFVYETDSVAAALCVMAVGGYCHIPVLDSTERIVGIVSPIRVATFLKQCFKTV